MTTGTVTLHRVIKTTPEKLYRAFTEANALAAWLPPYGFLNVVHRLDATVGGGYKMSFINFTTKSEQSFSGTYVKLTPNEVIQYTDAFDDPNLPGEMTTTISLAKVLGGTELKVTQEGIPAMIPTDMCYLGWQDSLDKLTKLVEPNIPDA